MLKQIFGDKKESNNLTQEPISKLQEVEEILKIKQDFLEEMIQTEITFARENAASNKFAALKALKRKKEYEKKQQHIDNVLQVIEYQKEILMTLATGTEQLELMDTVQAKPLMGDLAIRTNDIAEYGDEMTEAELISELEEIEREFEQETVNETEITQT